MQLARISEVDGDLSTYIRVEADAARAAASVAEREIQSGRRRSGLHGIPFAVKDNYDVAGSPTTAGSRLRLDHVPDRDAALVGGLRDAGAILLGKLATWEYGTGNGGEYFDLPFPPARNPWDPERATGGSSSGAGAAVAAGAAMFALGSDTTGSVRLPAGATGVVGLIPTPGLLSLEGILPNCHSLDVPGIFGWTVADVAAVLEALAPGRRASRSFAGRPDLAGIRLAVIRDPGPGFPPPDASMADAFEAGLAVLERLGATLVPTQLPVPAAECFGMTRLIGPAESASIHEAELRERPGAMGFALRDKLLAGSLVRAVDYIAAQRRRPLVAAGIEALLRDVDGLVTFGALHAPPRLGIEPEMTTFTVETMLTPFNLSGHPALVQCTGFTPGGLPLHWQMVAKRGDEAGLLQLAGAYETATPWRDRRPAPRAAPPKPAVAFPAGSDVGSRDIADFARRHGLGRLAPDHLARLAALVEPVASGGAGLPRSYRKQDGPSFCFGT